MQRSYAGVGRVFSPVRLPHAGAHYWSGQSGNRALAEQFKPEFSILDDSALQVSFAADIETVPTLLMVDTQG